MVSGLFSAIVLVSWKCYMMIQYCASQVGRVKPWKEYLYDRNWQTLLTTSWFFFFLFGCLSRLKKITEKMSMIQIKHNSMSYPRLPDCKYRKNEETLFWSQKPWLIKGRSHISVNEWGAYMSSFFFSFVLFKGSYSIHHTHLSMLWMTLLNWIVINHLFVVWLCQFMVWSQLSADNGRKRPAEINKNIIQESTGCMEYTTKSIVYSIIICELWANIMIPIQISSW